MAPQRKRIIELPGVFDEHWAEYDQARIRLWMIAASALYIILRWIAGGSTIPGPADSYILILPLPEGAAKHLLLLCLGYAAFGIALLAIIQKFPGNFTLRRLFTLICDFGALTYLLLVGEGPMMIFLAMILWVAVGNGMRFGRLNLIFAPILAQLSLFSLFAMSRFWQSRFDLLVTFAICFLILSAYSIVVLRQISQAREAALEAMQSKSRFLAQASHDLRQPIHSIGYYLDILRATKESADRNQLLDRIEKALGSVSRLFKSLLDISRIDSRAIEVRMETIDLHSLLADIVQQNEQHAIWNNVDLCCMPTSLKVRADPALLAMMIQNLLSNAIKYAPGARVLIGARRHGKRVAVEVYDQGIGIKVEHLPYIFDEFYRAHEAGDRDAEGVGLGLAIVNRLADLCGFNLTVKSERGRGTVARISDIQMSFEQVVRTPSVSNEPLRLQSNFRVILVEDDLDVLNATAAMLRHWGCDVQAYTEPPVSFQAADVIIADFDLGNKRLGTEAIRVIRKGLESNVPAILMTGHAEAIANQQNFDEGIQVLAKPVQPAMLRSILSTFRAASYNKI